MEYALEFIRDLAKSQLGEKDYRQWVPLLVLYSCSFLCQIGEELLSPGS